MGKLYIEKWGGKYFESAKTKEPISLIFYRKDDCEIYELPNNKIIKLSSSKEGYDTAKQLCGKQNKNVVDIYQYGYFKCTNHTNDDEELIYYIIMEKLNTHYIPLIIISEFVEAFRYCWFTLYRDEYEPYRYLNYEDLKTLLINPNNPSIEIVKNYMASYITSENKEIILSLYKETCNAYHELYLISPNAKIDFNEGNIGFTKEGVLKFYDLQ